MRGHFKKSTVDRQEIFITVFCIIDLLLRVDKTNIQKNVTIHETIKKCINNNLSFSALPTRSREGTRSMIV